MTRCGGWHGDLGAELAVGHEVAQHGLGFLGLPGGAVVEEVGTGGAAEFGARGAYGAEMEDAEVRAAGGSGSFGNELHAVGVGGNWRREHKERAVLDDHLDEGILVEHLGGHKGELVDDDDVAVEAARPLPADRGVRWCRALWRAADGARGTYICGNCAFYFCI